MAAAKTIYDFKAEAIDGAELELSAYAGKVVLILNTASLWGTTTRDFTQMNQICQKYGDQVAVLCFPCNQFGHQENSSGQEIVNALKHVRPGNGFVPLCSVMNKIEVNGDNEAPLFAFLKSSLPLPSDDQQSLMGDPKFFIWKPVKRTDIAWNFEKFLIAADGIPYKRYSKNFLVKDIAADIDTLLL